MLRKSRDNREMVYRYIQEYKRENFKSKISNFPEHNVNGMLCIDLPTEMELKNINGKTIFDRFIVDTQELKENSPLYKFEDPCDKKVLGADFGSIKQGSLKVKKLASELSYINLKSPDKTQNEFEKAQIYTEKQYNDSGNIEPWYTFSENDSKESSLTEFVGQNVNKFHFKPSKSKSVDDLCLINGRIKRINTTKSMNILKADTLIEEKIKLNSVTYLEESVIRASNIIRGNCEQSPFYIFKNKTFMFEKREPNEIEANQNYIQKFE
ncbi:hypothetical protein BB560_000808 [Smittium megazygosporum]|uniref:Uncharacterized protein n=1 Tax=Smittium megazygosporum TaxID=133381 RepID=A0A2T9ZJC7_9FUNG|nr:hypothetical protein BB560_000808 [Smittium megazygosporum]